MHCLALPEMAGLMLSGWECCRQMAFTGQPLRALSLLLGMALPRFHPIVVKYSMIIIGVKRPGRPRPTWDNLVQLGHPPALEHPVLSLDLYYCSTSPCPQSNSSAAFHGTNPEHPLINILHANLHLSLFPRESIP